MEPVELDRLVDDGVGGGNPCDFVIVNSPFDVVSLITVCAGRKRGKREKDAFIIEIDWFLAAALLPK